MTTKEFKHKIAFLNFIEEIKKMKKKNFNHFMYKAWMNIWKDENTSDAWETFEKSFLEESK